MNVNVVALTGNLTRDPELRATRSGTSVTTLRLAVNERVKRGDEWEDRANYFDVTVWGRMAENCVEYLEKGRPVAVQGRLQWSEWTDNNENKRQNVQVVADMVQFLNAGQGNSGGGRPNRTDPDEVPADTRGLPSSGGDMPSTGGADDDIPF